MCCGAAQSCDSRVSGTCREDGRERVREKIMIISEHQMMRKITNTCSHTLFKFGFWLGDPKLVSLMFYVRAVKVLSFHARAHVHLHVRLHKAPYLSVH